MRFHFLDLLAHVLFEVSEGMEGDGGYGRGSGLLLESGAQFPVLECQHAAVGVVDDDEFLRAQKLV